MHNPDWIQSGLDPKTTKEWSSWPQGVRGFCRKAYETSADLFDGDETKGPYRRRRDKCVNRSD
jgi:hypothetical protein